MPEEIKKPSFYETLHNKTFREILAEREKEPKVEEPKEDIKPPEPALEDQAKKDEEEKQRLELAGKQRKEQEEGLARKAAENVVALQKEQEQKRLEDLQRAEEAKKKEEELIPAWQKDPTRPKDPKTGEALPKSYDEIVAETRRIAKAEAIAEMEERDRKRIIETQAKTQEEKQRQDEAKRVQDEFNNQLQKEIDSDVNDLYATDKLPKIKDSNNPNDPGIVERNKLFETGMKVNKERIEKGQSPIRSIKLIYYEHYKPTSKPAGFAAPVAGATSTPAPQQDKYNYATDHKMTIGDYMRKIYKS